VSIQPGSLARTTNFQVDTSAAGGNVDFVDWYFGPDELRASGESVAHTFSAAGSYDVRVFVYMNNAAGGEVSQASVTVNVP
ncbi:MAG TPA: PKD domain-containing protein, partial [Polyangiaceae bacterium]|nr:PKD domain-containing protein [Polyangiaceae bacterium]